MRYVHSDEPGISRRKAGRGWVYFDPRGKRITDRREIDRLNAIALPPAYRDAWYSPFADAHLLATGRDSRGRKQYRYNPEFRQRKDDRKFANCLRFGQALPALRKRVAQDLRGRRASEARAIAALVRLLDCAHIRIGNEDYTRSNGSYGASTLTKRHVRRDGRNLRIFYRGKGGKEHDVELDDPALRRFVRDMQDLPGQRLFQFVDDDGAVRTIGSAEVNAYIRAAMGDAFSAKDFRTWSASVAALAALAEAPAGVSVTTMAEISAAQLGNTAAVARKAYIHPRLIAMAGGGARRPVELPRSGKWLSSAERGLLKLLASRRGALSR